MHGIDEGRRVALPRKGNHWSVGLMLIALLTAGSASAGECSARPAAAIDAVESRTGGLLIPATIGRHATYLTLDTGGFASLLFEDVVAVEGLHTRFSPRSAVGAGGGATHLIAVDHQRSYFVVPRGAVGDPRESGTLGADYYRGRDLDIDFPGRKIRLVAPAPCVGRVAAWTQDDSALPIRLDRYGRAYLSVLLDGHPLTALIDTGASHSILSPAVARRLFRLSPGGPGTVAAGRTIDAGGAALPTYRSQFRRLEFGGIVFDDPWLDLPAARRDPGAEMILGMHELRRLHLYFAFGEGRLYLTAAAVRPEPRVQPAGAQPWLGCLASGSGLDDTVIEGCSRVIRTGAGSRDMIAIAYSRRGSAYHRKAEVEKALADFEAALRIEPNFAYALYGRGLARNAAGDAAGGSADIAAALRVEPDIAQRFPR